MAGLTAHLVLRFGFHASPALSRLPLLIILVAGGVPLVLELLRNVWRREFGSDLLAGISIVTSVLLGEYLAGSIVVLMLSGGEALESYALGSASSVLRALAKRMPSTAHRKKGSGLEDVGVEEIA
ncbi:MAG: heavy metal translocating P-type ATPase, partial [Verrucomicrobiaceae bacterium]